MSSEEAHHETNYFLRDAGYSEAEIVDYYAILSRFRDRFHPAENQAADPREQYFDAADGSRIFVQAFIPDHPRAVVIGQPGNNCQSDLYFPLADHLNPLGIGLVAVDNRGHGRSGPARGKFNKPELMFDVYDAIIAQFKSIPIHLLGESLGTTMFAAYLANKSPASLVISSALFLVPPCKLRRQGLLGPLKWLIKFLLGLLRVFSLDRPFLAFKPDLRPTYFPEYHDIDLHDIIRAPKSTALHMLTLIHQIEHFPRDARSITIPLLVLAGTGDKDLDPSGAEELGRSSASSHVVVKIFEHADHSLMFDRHSQGSYDAIANWVAGGWRPQQS